MRDYHDFFYKIDILSLAYIFVKFIDMFFDIGLDPCHCFCNTGLSWDAMLKMAGTELELISDTDVYLFAENGVREGIAYIAKRYSKVNNKYRKSYDDSKPSKCFMFFDANNLYRWAISQFLPYSEFKWLNRKEINRFDINLINENDSHGYILEVDLEYSDELHELLVIVIY